MRVQCEMIGSGIMHTERDDRAYYLLPVMTSQHLLFVARYDARDEFHRKDNDMLECCNGNMTEAEYRSQFSTFAIQTSKICFVVLCVFVCVRPCVPVDVAVRA